MRTWWSALACILVLMLVLLECLCFFVMESWQPRRCLEANPQRTFVLSARIARLEPGKQGNWGNQLFEMSAAFCATLRNPAFLVFVLPTIIDTLPVSRYFPGLARFERADLKIETHVWQVDAYSETQVVANGAVHGIHGLRQSWRYLKGHEAALLHLFMPNAHFLQNVQKAVPPAFLALHIRRTDYFSPRYKNFLSHCSMDFYTRGLKEIYARVPSARAWPIFVCCDDRQFASTIVQKLSPHAQLSPVLKDVPADFTDWLVLFLASHVVIANSTFSWWAAYLGPWLQRKGTVVFPSLFFQPSNPRVWFLKPNGDHWHLPGWVSLHPQTGERADPPDGTHERGFSNISRVVSSLLQ